MRSYPIYLLCLTACLSSTSIFARKYISDIELLNNFQDLYVTNVTRIAFRITHEDGSIRYTKGLGRGNLSWSIFFIESNQARFNNGLIKINRKALIENKNVLELKIRIQKGKQLFSKIITYNLPPITKVYADIYEIVPYTNFKKEIKIETAFRTYTITPNSAYAAFRFYDFEWTFSDSLILNSVVSFKYTPTLIRNPQKVGLQLVHRNLGIKEYKIIPIQTLELLSLSHIGLSGRKGESGASGYDGSAGQDGDDGEDGYSGERGHSGDKIELVISKRKKGQVELQVYAKNTIKIYNLPINCTIKINASGGRGGNGGDYGDGGSGGGADINGNCGSDGSDGDQGAGGPGGNGGSIKVFSDLDILTLATILEVDISGGRGGSGYSNGSSGKSGTTEYTILSQEELNKLLHSLTN
ncbi:MAG: hypothetical protein COA58_06255 [Bacteroidetes bacterium]|nr:MAG: hypothetical protein COA58_06255 [Bacteroidota bacterium]